MTAEDLERELEGYTFDKFTAIEDGLGLVFNITGPNMGQPKTVVIAGVDEEDVTVE